MSELKAYIGPAPDEKGLADYYLKSEADKVIAHHKYKRCLAMARWCEAEVHRALTEQSALIDFPEIDRFQYLQWNFMHFKKWYKRWLELAEKFKPNSTAKYGKG